SPCGATHAARLTMDAIPRTARRRRALKPLERADPDEQPTLLDGGARDGEENDAAHGFGERRDRFADEIGHLANELALLHDLIDLDVTVEDPFDRGTQPIEALHDRWRRDALRTSADRADRAQDVRDSGDVACDVLLDELAAAAGLGQHRRDAVQG